MANEQKPSGGWAWLAVIAGALFWFLKRRKPKPPGPTPHPQKPVEYRERVTSYSLKALQRVDTVERAFEQLAAARLTSAGDVLCVRHGWNLIPWEKRDGIYRVVPGDVLWSESYWVKFRKLLALARKFGFLLGLRMFDWCSIRELIQDDWLGHPLNGKHSNSGMPERNQHSVFDLRYFGVTKLLVDKMALECRDFWPIVEFQPMNEPPEKTIARVWEKETLKYAASVGFERRISSLDDGDYANDLLKSKLTYAHQWHNIEDAGDIRKTGSQHIADTDGARNKPGLPYGEMARKAVRTGTHFYAMTPETLPDGTYTPSVIAALAGEMAWWHQQNPKH